MNKQLKIIIAGGGTGGHVFPAIAIANAIKHLDTNVQILFIGAQDRLEMEKVPQAGFQIVGLPIKGLKRSFTLQNIKTIFLLFKSIAKTKKVYKDFRPQVVIGVGGYASAPALHVAVRKKIPIVLQEQNSYPGITNRMFGKYAYRICSAYEEVKKYFPEEKVIITGNPVMDTIVNANIEKVQGLSYFGLDSNKKTLLITGGSLGARQLNKAVIEHLDLLREANINLIWQTGRIYYESIKKQVKEESWLKIVPFIENMLYAYCASDLVVSRAGAITISELNILGKAVIFVPSPNVAEDHQKKNALALVKHNAAIMIEDENAPHELIPKAISLLLDSKKIAELEKNIKKFAKPNAANEIAKIILEIAKTNKK